MGDDRHDRTGKLFVEALRQSETARLEWLRTACADDDDLFDDIRELLEHHEHPRVDMDQPALSGPSNVGQYRILETLGSGGMGVVYRAEQAQPRRHVALKVIRPGLVAERVLQRFEFEAQTLARLHHPGIAQIYEAGTAELGPDEPPRPFFSMELVDGIPIDAYVRDQDLDIAERLALVARVCDAVEHAHVRGVIHRDIKPANVLVESGGQPKVLDFGVARTTNSDIRTTTMRTIAGQLIGTLPYMSPEQCRETPDDIDTRCDVYALGVLMYELLTGRHPLELEGRAIHESVRMICDDEPTPLSSLDRRLSGDVETIVSRALEKEAGRRYQSAGELAEDIRRHLVDEPILARPPSAWYQLTKFARRHRMFVGAAASLAVVVLAAFVLTVVLLARALNAETDARNAAADARAIGDFLGTLLATANPYATDDSADMTVRDLIDDAASEASVRFEGRPLVEASIRRHLGRAYIGLAQHQKAADQFDRAHHLLLNVHGPLHPDALDVELRGAVQLLQLGRIAEAATRIERARELVSTHHPSDEVLAMTAHDTMGRLRHEQARFDDAITELEHGITLATDLLGADHFDTLVMRIALATVSMDAGRRAEALELFREVEQAYMRALPADHPTLLATRGNIMRILMDEGQLDEAETLARQLLTVSSSKLGETHPRTIRAQVGLANVLRRMDRLDEAEPIAQQAADAARNVHGEDETLVLDCLSSLALILEGQQKLTPAIEILGEVAERRASLLGPDHPKTLGAESNYGFTLFTLGRHDEAGDVFRPLLDRATAVLGPDHIVSLTVANNLASIHYRRDELDIAEPLFRRVVETQRRTLASDAPALLQSLQNHARTLVKLGRAPEALPMYDELLEVGDRVYAEGHLNRGIFRVGRALALVELDRGAEAELLLTEAVPILRRAIGDQHAFTQLAFRTLGDLCDAAGRSEDGATWRALLVRPE